MRWLALLLLAFSLPAQESSARESSLANVLLVLADDIGPDDIGVYAEGGPAPPTPNIDALAADGVLFRNVWGNPVCSPTRALILTGRYATRTGIGIGTHTHPIELRPSETTLPELLDVAFTGYVHAAFGKWHLGGGETGPNDHGFDHFAGFVDAGGISYFSWPRTVNGVTAISNTYATTQNVDDALAWLATAPEPWFCYVAFVAAHFPLHEPPSNLHTQNLAGLDPQVTPIPFFHAMVEAMDSEFGRLLASMDPAVLSRTNVFFSTDNGPDSRTIEPPLPTTHGKATLYEGGVGLPLIVAGPAVGGVVPREEPALVSSVDLFATVGELAGVGPIRLLLSGRDSASFVSLLSAGGQLPPRTLLFSEFFDPTPTFDRVAVRDGQYKLIRNMLTAPNGQEFYDLVADPYELSNLLPLPNLTVEQRAAYDVFDAEIVRVRKPRIVRDVPRHDQRDRRFKDG